MAKKTKKIPWFKRQVVKVQILPWYWKMVATVVIFFAGGTLGTQLFTEADDVSMIGGFALLVISSVVSDSNVAARTGRVTFSKTKFLIL